MPYIGVKLTAIVLSFFIGLDKGMMIQAIVMDN